MLSGTSNLGLQVEDAMADIESWENFNVFSVAKLVQGHILATIVFFSLEHYSLIEKLGLPEDKLLNFVAVCNLLSKTVA